MTVEHVSKTAKTYKHTKTLILVTRHMDGLCYAAA